MWSPNRVRVAVASMALPVLLASSVSGCTGAPEPERADPTRPAPSPSPSATTTESAPSLQERAAPYDLGYRRVAGGLPRGERQRLLRALTRPVRAWVDGGFVDGPWPRARFRSAFTPFTRGAAGAARRNAGLLTLHTVAPSLVDVVPERRRIRLSVTSSRDRAVGATARVDLRFVGLTEKDQRVRVDVRGDVYLTRPDARGWQIFGYDLDRWVEGGGA